MKLAYSMRRICAIFIVLQSHDCKSRRLRFEQSVWIWEKHLLYSMSNTLWIILGINRGNPKDLWQSSHLSFRAMIEFSCSDMNQRAPRSWAANLKWGHCKTNTEWQRGAQSSTETTHLQSGSPTLPETAHSPPLLHISGRKEPDEPTVPQPCVFLKVCMSAGGQSLQAPTVTEHYRGNPSLDHTTTQHTPGLYWALCRVKKRSIQFSIILKRVVWNNIL